MLLKNLNSSLQGVVPQLQGQFIAICVRASVSVGVTRGVVCDGPLVVFLHLHDMTGKAPTAEFSKAMNIVGV